jgi:hypothetical protein
MSCHLSMNLMELVVALTTQLDFCHNSQKKKFEIPGLAAIASRRGKSAEITNVNNDE